MQRGRRGQRWLPRRAGGPAARGGGAGGRGRWSWRLAARGATTGPWPVAEGGDGWQQGGGGWGERARWLRAQRMMRPGARGGGADSWVLAVGRRGGRRVVQGRAGPVARGGEGRRPGAAAGGAGARGPCCWVGGSRSGRTVNAPRSGGILT
ncbi:hypothetical protein GUJ93_ZPchr0001g31462 [Zizania palustris]|uniref:Uncharacterized protein n=1 Tax=Zizania palustris TaxID=103762 RepID=A0A8J5V0H4_ZIZPA|nr:hypothetical protein GUJ93_ZPchr0001g31462 [Zizania palustris]